MPKGKGKGKVKRKGIKDQQSFDDAPTETKRVTGKAKTKAAIAAPDGGNVQSLIERARHAEDSLEPDLALKFYKRALEIAPEEPSLLDECADLMVRLGDCENAMELLTRSIAIAPDAGASKWLYMAQMHDGEKALEFYRKGLQILERDLELGEEEESKIGLQQQRCTAYCAVAELYMTDLCFDPEAEQECQKSLDCAMQHDCGSLEPYQAMANLRLSQERGEEAVPYIKEAVRRLRACNSESLPDYGTRVTTAKVLLECGQHDPSCCEEALEVLAELMKEDDENVEIWFLMGAAFFNLESPDIGYARSHLERAAEMLAKVKEEWRTSGESIDEFPYLSQETLVQEQLALVAEAEANIDPNADNADDSQDEGEEGEQDGDHMDLDG